jgi:hypothetical protein
MDTRTRQRGEIMRNYITRELTDPLFYDKIYLNWIGVR